MTRKSFVVPVMVDPHRGVPFLVLACNRDTPTWPSGSGRLTMLGGSARRDEDAAATAARETMEETMGCLLWDVHDSSSYKHWRRKGAFAARLRDNGFLFSLKKQGDVSVFVVVVPWDPGCCRRFSHCRNVLRALDKSVKQQRRSSRRLRCEDLNLSPQERAALLPNRPHVRRQRHKWILSHPSTVVDRESEPPVIVAVKKEFLEKRSLHALSLPQVFSALGSTSLMVPGLRKSLLGTHAGWLREVVSSFAEMFPHQTRGFCVSLSKSVGGDGFLHGDDALDGAADDQGGHRVPDADGGADAQRGDPRLSRPLPGDGEGGAVGGGGLVVRHHADGDGAAGVPGQDHQDGKHVGEGAGRVVERKPFPRDDMTKRGSHGSPEVLEAGQPEAGQD